MTAYNAVLSACGCASKWEPALQVFQELRSQVGLGFRVFGLRVEGFRVSRV